MSKRDLFVKVYKVKAFLVAFGLVGAVVSIMHCGCIDPGSIPGLDNNLLNFRGLKAPAPFPYHITPNFHVYKF